MNISKFVVLFACVAGLTQSAWSQQAPGSATPGILGHLDSRFGSFKPAQKDFPDIESLAALSATTGKFVTNFTINVASALPSNAVVTCTVSAAVVELTTGVPAFETATVQAVRKGSSASCSVVIPYSFNLATPASDSVNLSYVISAGSLPTKTTVPVLSRVSEQPIGSVKVPSNGATITNNVKSTI